MNIILLGKGKTGGKVIDVAAEKDYNITALGRSNPLNKVLLNNADIVISFLPGEAFLEYLDLLLDSKVNLVSGSTGIVLPSETNKKLIDRNMTWIQGHNFSLGMNLVHEMISVLSKANQLFGDQELQFDIHEVHHTKKLDSPSGTALRWKEWLNQPAKLTSDRIGDVIGDHILTMKSPTEEITLRHQVNDRKIFAAGAVWSAELIHNKKIKPGLHWFEQIAKQFLN